MKMNKGAKIIVINILVFLGLLLLIEGVFRIKGKRPYAHSVSQNDIVVDPGGKFFTKDSLLGYRHLPGDFHITQKDKLHFSVSHDEDAHRLSTTTEVLDSLGVQDQIWALGCSYTHGWSVNNEETFMWQLQSRMPEYNWVNWACSGYGTVHFRQQLLSALEDSEPHLVFVNHADFHHQRNVFSRMRRQQVSEWNFLGELNQPFAGLGNDGELVYELSKVLYEPLPLSRYSAFANWCNQKFDQYEEQQTVSESLEVTRLIYKDMIDLCKEHDVIFVLVNIDGAVDFPRQIAKENGVPFLNISLDLRDDQYTSRPIDAHPNAKAHAIYANRLYDYFNDFLYYEHPMEE